MNLPFTTTFSKTLPPLLAGKNTNFVPKILLGLTEAHPEPDQLQGYVQNYVFHQRKLKEDYQTDVIHPKLHTFRVDSTNKWQPGNDIHFYIYANTTSQLHFAPILKCKSIQLIEIIWNDPDGFRLAEPQIYIDDTWIIGSDLDTLIFNDGFNSQKHFFSYFNTTFKGKIIHWTNLKY